ncbi:MAG: hypothetical protein AAGH48_01995, partial [Pseudomonadota bacterium]
MRRASSRSVRRWALVGAAAFAACGAQALAQDEEATPPPGGSAVQVEALEPENPFSYPLTGDARPSGNTPDIGLWAGSGPDRLGSLLTLAPDVARAPALTALLSDTLRDGGAVPSGFSDQDTLSLGGQRALALVRIGDAASARRLRVVSGTSALADDPS